MGKETKNLVLEVSSGIVIFTVAAMLVALIVYPKPSVFAGLLLGMVLALAMFFSMAEVLDRSMKTEDSKTVQKRTVISSVIRYVVLFAVLVIVVVWFPDWLYHAIGEISPVQASNLYGAPSPVIVTGTEMDFWSLEPL